MRFLIFTSIFFINFLTYSQKILKNINPGTNNSNPESAITISHKTYFLATENSKKLFCFDNVNDSTYLVNLDINIYSINQLFSFKNELYLFGSTSSEGNELFKLDQLTNNIVPFKNFISGPNGVSTGEITLGNDLIYFSFQNPQELWVSDGTSNNTMKLIDLSFESLDKRKCIGDKLFFLKSTPDFGKELWVSNGSIAGTFMVKDINVGIGDSYIFHLETLGSYLIFNAYNSTFNHELWKSNGTLAGTQIIQDLETGSGGSYPNTLIKFNNEIYFNAQGSKLFKTDGSSISHLKDINIKNQKIAFDGELYFLGANSEFGTELWKTDGTPQGTILVNDIFEGPSSSFEIFDWTSSVFGLSGGNLIFKANDGIHGVELFKYDKVSISLLKEFTGGDKGSFIGEFYNVQNDLVFTASMPDGGRELWLTNGTPLGTKLLADINPLLGLNVTYPLAVNNQDFIFLGFKDEYGFEPWIYNSLNQTLTILKDINIGQRRTLQDFFTNFEYQQLGNKFVFWANDYKNGNELWATDGTETGTYLLKDFSPYNYYYYNLTKVNPNYDPSTYLNSWIRFNDNLFIIVNNNQLWKIDSNLVFEKLLDIGESPILNGYARMPLNMVTNGNKIFFNIGPNKSIYESDGTGIGTILVSSDFYDSNLFGFINQSLVFAANRDPYGKEIFRLTNGILELIKDINPGYSSSIPPTLGITIQLNSDKFIFEANNGLNGKELWSTDGTEIGTVLLKDFTIGSGSTNYVKRHFFINQNEVIFVSDDSIYGKEIWKTDGTPSGTVLVKDISIGFSSEFDFYAFRADSARVIYQLNDNINGREPWITDGTVSGTKLIKDVSSGLGWSFVNPDVGVVKFDNSVFFQADNKVWNYNLSSGLCSIVEFSNVVSKNGSLFVFKNSLYIFGTEFNNGQYKINLFRFENGIFKPLIGFKLNFSSNQPFQIFSPIIINNKLIFKVFSNDEEYYVSNICNDFENIFQEIIGAKTVMANVLVNASSSINTNEKVFFTSEKSILLNPGFKTSFNGTFSAQISGCVNLNE